jgi:ABC-2 type transport system permease protein
MLTNVFTKAVLDRWKPPLIAGVSLAALLVFGMAVYRGINVAFWDDLPEVFREVFGIPAGAGVGGLAYGGIYSGYGMLMMAAVALAGGAVSVSGEERNGTAGLLLGNPVSRTNMALSKAAALAAATAAGFIILWLAGMATPVMLDVEISTMDVSALVVMMFANALFYGFFAFALSGWTGRSSVAAGVSAGVMVVSFLAVGLLPLVDELAGLAMVFPWYYFSNGDPLLNGVSWRDFGILAAGIVAFLIIGVVGVSRRDLRSQSVGIKLIDRLRSNPLTHKAAEKLAGTARVSKIWIKTASEHQVLLYVIVPALLLMSVMIGPMYTMLDDTLLKTLGDEFPEALLALFGGGDMGTPEGFYQIEMFGMMIPICIVVVTVAIGTAALAGEEKNNTMGLLLANPVRRSTIIIQKTWTMILYALVVGFSAFVGVAAGSLLGNLGMDMGNIAATCVLATLLGLVFGGMALALGAATGRTQIASYGAVGVAVVAFIVNGFLPLNDSTAGWAKVSPFYYYLSSDPLVNGMHWGHAVILSGLFVFFLALSIVVFQHRDLRQTG